MPLPQNGNDSIYQLSQLLIVVFIIVDKVVRYHFLVVCWRVLAVFLFTPTLCGIYKTPWIVNDLILLTNCRILGIMVEPAVEYLNFPKEEEKILEFWKETDVFHECLRQSKGKPR